MFKKTLALFFFLILVSSFCFAVWPFGETKNIFIIDKNITYAGGGGSGTTYTGLNQIVVDADANTISNSMWIASEAEIDANSLAVYLANVWNTDFNGNWLDLFNDQPASGSGGFYYAGVNMFLNDANEFSPDLNGIYNCDNNADCTLTGDVSSTNGSFVNLTVSGATITETDLSVYDDFNAGVSGSYPLIYHKAGNFSLFGGTASGLASWSIMPLSESNGAYSFANGFGAIANSDYSIAMGNEAYANNNYAIAIGNGASADGLDNVAIGSGADANVNGGTGCVAMGNGAICDELGEVTLSLDVNVARNLSIGNCVTLNGKLICDWTDLNASIDLNGYVTGETLDANLNAFTYGSSDFNSVYLNSGSGIAVEVYYPTDINSDIATYEALQSFPDTNSHSDSVTVSSGTGQVLVDQYITALDNPSVTVIPAGTYTFNNYVSISSDAGETYFDVNVFKYDSNGLITPFFGVTTTEVNEATPTLYTNIYVLTSDVEIAIDARFIVRWYVRNDHATSKTATLYYGGANAYTHVITSLPKGGDIGFVRYSGNTRNLDMGDFNVTAEEFVGGGAGLTGIVHPYIPTQQAIDENINVAIAFRMPVTDVNLSIPSVWSAIDGNVTTDTNALYCPENQLLAGVNGCTSTPTVTGTNITGIPASSILAGTFGTGNYTIDGDLNLGEWAFSSDGSENLTLQGITADADFAIDVNDGGVMKNLVLIDASAGQVKFPEATYVKQGVDGTIDTRLNMFSDTAGKYFSIASTGGQTSIATIGIPLVVSSAGSMYLSSSSYIYQDASAGFVWRDNDDGDATRMTLTSASGLLDLTGDLRLGFETARIRVGMQNNSGDVHFGSSGIGSPPNGEQDYGFYTAYNAYRSTDGNWYHSRQTTTPASRFAGGGTGAAASNFTWDYSTNVGSSDITWTNLMTLASTGELTVKGCRANFTRYGLGCIQTAEEGSGTIDVASEDCYDTYGGRLPSLHELSIAFNNLALTDETDDDEWVSAGVDWDDVNDYEHTFLNANVGTDISDGDVTTAVTSKAYRCFVPFGGGT